MTSDVSRTPAQPPVRLAAIAYLGTIIFGIFAQVVALGRLEGFEPGQVTGLITGVGSLYRVGIVCELAMLACYLVVTAVFYAAFRPRDRTLSLIAALFSLTGIAVLAAGIVQLTGPLFILADSPVVASVWQAEASTTSLRLHGSGYTISLVFFGVYCLMIGGLIIRSRLIPPLVGLLMAFAGLCYLGNSLRVLLAIPFPADMASYLLLPGLIGEGAISLWLLAKGLNRAEWERLHQPA